MAMQRKIIIGGVLMSGSTKVKITVLIIIVSWGILLLAMGADPFYEPGAAAVLLVILPEFLIAPLLLFSIIIDLTKNKEKQKNENIEISLARKILKVAYENNKQVSVYDIMIKVNEKEENIRKQLIEFEQKGVAERYITSQGQEMYRFNISISEDERKDILES